MIYFSPCNAHYLIIYHFIFNRDLTGFLKIMESAIFGQIWSNFGLKKVLFSLCYIGHSSVS